MTDLPARITIAAAAFAAGCLLGYDHCKTTVPMIRRVVVKVPVNNDRLTEQQIRNIVHRYANGICMERAKRLGVPACIPAR